MTETPDLIVTNAVVRTMDPERPEAAAFAVADGRFVAVGGADEIGALAGASTRVVDLGGAAVVPGLMDVHNHHGIAGQHAMFELQFPDTATVPEIVEAVRAYIVEHPDHEWVIGSTWGSGLFADLSDPASLAALDEASGDVKVLLTDDAHHNKWANTAAMRAAGIDDTTPDPEGGRIVRDAAGHATGLLLEAAGAAVARVAASDDPMTAEKSAVCSANGIATMHAVGITAFLDAAATEATLEGLKLLDDRGDLTAHASSAMLINDQIFGAEKLGDDLFPSRDRTASPHHRPDFAKIFLDGVPTSGTAAFLEPYTPTPEHGDCHRGHTTMPPEELERWLLHCAELGINVKIHCTGDASVRAVLDAVQAVREAGHADTIYHVAHGQFVAPEDVARFAELGVVADISPVLWFPGLITEVIAAVRSEAEMARMHPNRELTDTHAIVSGGSDWPVAPDPNPWIGIGGLVTRRDPTGQYPGELGADQALTAEEALAVYTINTARALGIQDVAGSIAPGKSADFVVLDRDPFTVAGDELFGTTTRETWFEGARVFPAAD